MDNRREINPIDKFTDKKDEKPAKKEVKKKFLKKTKPDGTIETTLIEKRYGKRWESCTLFIAEGYDK